MSLTEINAIDENYPVAGIDQTSQTFRDNFDNIKTALIDLDSLVITVINDLGDVDTTSVVPVLNDILTFDGVDWVPAAPTVIEIIDDLTPQLGGNLDVNGFHLGDGTTPIVDLVKSATPVNWLVASNSDVSSDPSLSVAGSDVNIDLILGAKGNGSVIIGSDTTTSKITSIAGSALSMVIPDNASGSGYNLELVAGSSTGAGGDGGIINLKAGTHDTTGTGGAINLRDHDNKVICKFRGPITGTSANYLSFRNGSTTNAPLINAAGTDANVDIKLYPLGTGQVVLSDMRYPNADGSADYVMKTDGSGSLSFAAPTDLGEFTVAGLPDPTLNADSYALATNASGGRTIVRSDGTNWKVVAVEGATVTT